LQDAASGPDRRQDARGKGRDADRDVHPIARSLWHVTGQDAASKRQDAYKEVTIARLAQDV
jgi:hypothetical protein